MDATARQVFRDKVRSALMEGVCRFCVDRQEDGPPCIIEGTPCCVFGHIEPLTDAVLDSFETDMRPYLLKVRQKVCNICEHQHADGSCDLREETLCPLNNYLPLVVEAIESARYGPLDWNS